MKEVIFLGAKPVGYFCLEFLVANEQQLGIKISAVLTNQTHKLSGELNIPEFCKKRGIDLIETLPELLNYKNADFLISVQYNNILKKEHLQKANELAVNLHMAPLPEYRGCNQFSYALIEEKKEFGTTLHVMDESIDGGDILFERRFPIPTNCFVDELYNKTVSESILLFKEKIGDVFKGSYNRIPQQKLIASRGTSLHYRKEIAPLKIIDLSWPPEKIERYVRATYFPPFDPPYAIVNGNKISLTSIKTESNPSINH